MTSNENNATHRRVTRPGNPDNLRKAAAAKRQAAAERAENGLRQLIKTGAPIAFEAVASAASVSKDFLYRSPDLRRRIEQLRAQTAKIRPRLASSTSHDGADEISSVVRTLTQELTEERAQHRQEIAELRSALAAAHGQLLTLKRRYATPE